MVKAVGALVDGFAAEGEFLNGSLEAAAFSESIVIGVGFRKSAEKPALGRVPDYAECSQPTRDPMTGERLDSA
jgi:hypothetical protein